MNAATHTPGPWSIANERDIQATLPNLDLVNVATVWRTNGGYSEDKANRALIAAAPELLSACRAALDSLRPKKAKRLSGVELDAIERQLRGAIYSATGEG